MTSNTSRRTEIGLTNQAGDLLETLKFGSEFALTSTPGNEYVVEKKRKPIKHVVGTRNIVSKCSNKVNISKNNNTINNNTININTMNNNNDNSNDIINNIKLIINNTCSSRLTATITLAEIITQIHHTSI